MSNNIPNTNGRKGKNGTLGGKIPLDRKVPNFEQCIEVIELLYGPGEWFQFPRIIHKIEVGKTDPPEGEDKRKLHPLKDSAIVLASALSQSCLKKAHLYNRGWFEFSSETAHEDTGYSVDRVEEHIKRLEGFGLITTRRASKVHGYRETKINWNVLIQAISRVQRSSYGDSPEVDTGIPRVSHGESPEHYKIDKKNSDRSFPSGNGSAHAEPLDPDDSLPPDEDVPPLENYPEEEESTMPREVPGKKINRIENNRTPPSLPPSPAPSPKGKDPSHGQKIKGIGKDRIGPILGRNGRSIPPLWLRWADRIKELVEKTTGKKVDWSANRSVWAWCFKKVLRSLEGDPGEPGYVEPAIRVDRAFKLLENCEEYGLNSIKELRLFHPRHLANLIPYLEKMWANETGGGGREEDPYRLFPDERQ